MWVFYIVVIALIIFIKFYTDTQKVKKKNLILGGLKKLMPQWVDFAKKNGMELVKDDGKDMEFIKRFGNDSGPSFEFYLAIQSSFGHIASGWVIQSNGNKIKTGNVEFKDNPTQETIEYIFGLIAEDLKSKGFDIGW